MHHAQTYAVILVLVSVLRVNCLTTQVSDKQDTATTTTDTKQDTTTTTTDTKQDVKATPTEQSNVQGTNMTTTTPDTLDVNKIKDMFPTIFAILEKYENATNVDYGKVLEEIKKDSKYADDKDDDPENGSRNNHVAIGSVVMVTMISMFLN